MSVAIISTSRLARPSSVTASVMSDEERLAFGTREIDFCIDAAEQATEYAGIVLRDRARALPVTVTGGTMSSLNSRPAIDFGSDAGGRMTVAYQMPSSYFVAAALAIDTITTTNTVVGSADASGDRLFFGILSNGHPYLSHGFDAGESIDWTTPPTVTGTHLFWGSFDAATGDAVIGLDAVTPGWTRTISVPHKGWPTTDFFGAAGVGEIDGRAAIAVVVPRYLGGSQQAATREAILAWLAAEVGVSLAA